ncbi:Mast cell carboxypeptidase A [Lamellibrachia satsuma]|nr:Mast cell carboxypeptidase A [Lamellibrachia satsuma]
MFRLHFEELLPDLSDALSAMPTASSLSSRTHIDDFSLDEYHTYEEINWWLYDMERRHSNVMSVFELGRSWEDRSMIAVKVSSPGRTSTPKPAIWLDAAIHANEWIGPATLLYFIKQFATGYENDPAVKKLIDSFDWYILPVFNVDGYVYTWKENRLWRKNRSMRDNDTGCVGVDLNRNWDAKWEEHTITDKCSPIYPGSSAFSEPETEVVSTFLQRHANVVAAVSYHSYSQYWMIPFGYSNTRHPSNYNQLMNMSRAAVEALRQVHGTQYQYGSVDDLVGQTFGSSVDYIYDKLGILYTFGVELRDRGRYCSLLPPNQIIPNAEESLAAITQLASMISDALPGDSDSTESQ